MKKITRLLFLCLLMNNHYSFSQSVTIDAITVNGMSISTQTPINLGDNNTTTVTLTTKVALTVAPKDDKPGSINIYYQKSSSSNPVSPTGGQGGNLLFSGSTTTSRSFVISLESVNFDPKGGIIYAEYEDYSHTKYKSSPVSITKNSNSNGGYPPDVPDPSSIANTLCCNQIVRLGDKPNPIIGSQYSNPYENYSYGINSSWSVDNPLQFTVDNVNKTLNFDYTTELKNIAVTRSLGYKSSTNLPNKSNTVTITVVPSPFLGNTISVNNAPENSEGYSEFSSLKSINIDGYVAFVDLNILNDPYHTYVRSDQMAYPESHKWEYAKIDKNNQYGIKNWILIPNENSDNLYNFNPTLSNSATEDNYYLVRRIAIYNNISRVSNEVKIMTRKMGYNNTICCDQSLKITSATSFEGPQIITGSTPTINNTDIAGTALQIVSISYQWQYQTLSRGVSIWSDIPGATTKDYLPSQPLNVIFSGGRGGSYIFESTYNYRRIAKIEYYTLKNVWVYGTTISYSNETSLTGSSTEPSIKIYPNPTSSILNIESTSDISNSMVSITNITGSTTNYNYSITNPNTISIDVSNLILGTYFITIKNNSQIIQKTFIKQ